MEREDDKKRAPDGIGLALEVDDETWRPGLRIWGFSRETVLAGRAVCISLLLGAAVLVALPIFCSQMNKSGLVDGLARQIVKTADAQAWAAWNAADSQSAAYDICPQVEPWTPSDEAHPLPRPPSRETLARLLSGSVKIDTSVYDDFPLPVNRDPELWAKVFKPHQEYLASAFPDVHNTPDKIDVQVVNSHGLLYTWKGKNDNLKPIIFMAHQDVVPVEPTTRGQWTHDPFSGYIDLDKDLVYGRGASDDKASLITLLASVTSLLKSGFEPQRTIILSFGFDEETSGTQGALRLAQRLEEVYGSHHDGKGAYMIVDEGMGVDAQTYGVPIAGPAVAEKGYVDVRVSVKAPGGHSSQPPRHTSIGLLSRVIAAIEDALWYPTMAIQEQKNFKSGGTAGVDNPGLETLLCTYDTPGVRDTALGKSMRQFVKARRRLRSMEINDRDFLPIMYAKRRVAGRARRSLFRARRQVLRALTQSEEDVNQFKTTQAVDIISGGVKVNALPELANAVINYRINVEQSVADVHEHLTNVACSVAQAYKMRLLAWGKNVTECGPSDEQSELFSAGVGTLVLEDAFDSPLESAPRTPTHGEEAGPYRLFSSVVRHAWSGKDGIESNASAANILAPIRVAPFVMTGNTDTQRYWNLTQHIFRFSPSTLKPVLDRAISADLGIHTVNEVAQIDSLSTGFVFYTSLMAAVQ